MTFEEWWESITDAERKMLGQNNAKFVWDQAQQQQQENIETLYMLYQQACQQRDALMDMQRAQIEAARGRIQ